MIGLHREGGLTGRGESFSFFFCFEKMHVYEALLGAHTHTQAHAHTHTHTYINAQLDVTKATRSSIFLKLHIRPSSKVKKEKSGCISLCLLNASPQRRAFSPSLRGEEEERTWV